MNSLKKISILLALLFLVIALSGCPQPPRSDWTEFPTYNQREADLILEDGKPVIFLFSTTGCPHCVWIKGTFDSTVQEYVDSGQIVAYHWELDTNDNTLTADVETIVPTAHMALWQTVNPRGSIPTFVLGGVYTRIGTGYENNNKTYNDLGDLEAEEAELRDIIEELINKSSE